MKLLKQIVLHSMPKYVKVPQGDRLKEIVEVLETCRGFTQAAGATDGTCIPIILPQLKSCRLL